MTIDPKGTTPGLVPGAEIKPKEFHMKCRNSTCNGMLAIIIQMAGQDRSRMYRCTSCNHTWGVNVGGAINL